MGLLCCTTQPDSTMCFVDGTKQDNKSNQTQLMYILIQDET